MVVKDRPTVHSVVGRTAKIREASLNRSAL
jgi:hypothetical protein